MSRRFTLVTVGLTAVVAFLVGAIVAGGFLRPAVGAQGLGARRVSAPTAATISSPRAALPSLVNFADVVERVNPAVVNIDATSDSSGGPRGGAPRRGAGSGFIIDADGSTSDEALMHEISAHAPGTTSELRLLRDGREFTIAVKLAERPSRDPGARRREKPAPSSDSLPPEAGGPMGLAVRELDAAAFNRLRLPRETRGVLITRVDPLSATFDADVQRGTVLLEINRKPILSVSDYRRVAAAVRPGDVLTFYVYTPDAAERQLKTVRLDDR